MDNSEKNLLPPWPFFLKEREDVVLIHIPKTAGTSVSWSLGFNRIDQAKNMRKHYKAKEIIDLIGQTQWNKAFKFAFVRNPWDRLLSFYHFRLRKNMITEKAFQTSFKKWAFFELTERNPATARPFNLEGQTYWLRDQQDKIQLNFIGRFEDLERDFKTLNTKLSLNTDLLHLNKNTLDIDYRQHYDSELALLVARYYQDDIDFFGYTF